MIHPLFKTLVTEPGLLAEHLGAYVQLASVEVGQTAAQLRSRAALTAAMVVSAALGVGLGGVALLLLAVVPVDQMPLPWLLAAVPALPLLLAAVCGWQARRKPLSYSFELLRQQLELDAALLREASDS